MQTDDPRIWEQLYSNEQFVFSTIPNQYFAEKLLTLNTGNILLPGDGEGRNAVYSAQQNWIVTATDLSENGKIKALHLAKSLNVNIKFLVEDIANSQFPENDFDAVALIFVHFMPKDRRAYHRKIISFLKPGGHLILEGFARPKSVGEDITFDLDELKEDFQGLDLIECKREIVNLNEGIVINGRNEVVRIFGKKR